VSVESSKVPSRSRGVRTRAKLVEAAQGVFERDGYLDARVADISAAAGVAHGSFYTYFDSKQDVFRELAEGVVGEVQAAIDAADEGTDEARIRAANRRYFEVYERHAAVLGLIEQVAALDEFHDLRKALRAKFVSRVERTIRSLRPNPSLRGMNPHVIAHALVGLNDGFAYSTFVMREPFNRDDALATLDAIWLRTLGIGETSA
jgi:AcrR family transcriptional regulator